MPNTWSLPMPNPASGPNGSLRSLLDRGSQNTGVSNTFTLTLVLLRVCRRVVSGRPVSRSRYGMPRKLVRGPLPRISTDESADSRRAGSLGRLLLNVSAASPSISFGLYWSTSAADRCSGSVMPCTFSSMSASRATARLRDTSYHTSLARMIWSSDLPVGPSPRVNRRTTTLPHRYSSTRVLPSASTESPAADLLLIQATATSVANSISWGGSPGFSVRYTTLTMTPPVTTHRWPPSPLPLASSWPLLSSCTRL